MTTLMTIPKTPYPSIDDARLAQQARADPEAFAELYRRHVRSIYRYHLAHTRDIRDAEDLTSQTFMAALEGIRSYRGTGPYITWLIGIASRKRALFFRRSGNKPEVPLDAAPPDGPGPWRAPEHQPRPRRSIDPLFL
jgi:DNA-directed RNA polymerase specialized sigma24 family protein